MVNAKIALDESAKRAGFEIVYVPADTATDVPDAAAALMSRDIDAVLQIPGNLTASAFGSISEAARRRPSSTDSSTRRPASGPSGGAAGASLFSTINVETPMEKSVPVHAASA